MENNNLKYKVTRFPHDKNPVYKVEDPGGTSWKITILNIRSLASLMTIRSLASLVTINKQGKKMNCPFLPTFSYILTSINGEFDSYRWSYGHYDIGLFMLRV